MADDPTRWSFDEYVFTTQSNGIEGVEKSGSGFGAVPIWLPTKPVSRPVKWARYGRHRWWRGCWYASHCLGRPGSKLHNWIVDQDCRASRQWYLAQVDYGSITIRGMYRSPEEAP